MLKRNGISILAFLIITVLLWYEMFILQGEYYYYVAVAIMVIGILAFLLQFEKSKPSVELLTMIAALCGIAIGSRIMFFFLPQVKPMAAIVIIAGIAFGRECGFITGAISAFVSNFYFGQGSWTLFQMFALGLIGYLAGVFFQKKRNYILVAVYGFLSIVCIYGGIVDLNTLFYMLGDLSWEGIATVYLTGLPFNIMYGVSTFAFLILLQSVILKRINRICKKYRLIDKIEKI